MLAEAIKNRWSPRSFAEKEITNENISLLFEAARWAPSAMNEQPWQYFYAKRENKESFKKLVECLLPGNQVWAKSSQLLIVSVVKKNYDHNSRPNRNAFHDIGAANVSIAIQAAQLGFQVHQMGGFDRPKTVELLNLETDNFEPVVIIAVGYHGNPEDLPDELKLSELADRKRKPVSEFTSEL